ADYGRALAQDNKNVTAYSARGNAYMSLFEYAKARDDFGQLIKLQPAQAQPYRLHGLASMRLLDFEAARRDWNELAKITPRSIEPYQFLAVTCRAQQRYDDAVAALAKVIDLKPDDPKGYLTRAQVYHQQGKLDEALADQTLVQTKLTGKTGDTLNDYGDLLRTLGRKDDGMAAYRESIELVSKQTDAYVSLAGILLANAKSDEAEKTIDRMLAANPDSLDALLRRAEFRRSRGQWDKAIADCDEAAK